MTDEKQPPKWLQDLVDKTGWTVAKVLRTLARDKRKREGFGIDWEKSKKGDQ